MRAIAHIIIAGTAFELEGEQEVDHGAYRSPRECRREMIGHDGAAGSPEHAREEVHKREPT